MMIAGAIILGCIGLALAIHTAGMEISRAIVAQRDVALATKDVLQEATRALDQATDLLRREIYRQSEERHKAEVAAKAALLSVPMTVYDD